MCLRYGRVLGERGITLVRHGFKRGGEFEYGV